MITYVNGNVFQSPAKVLVNPVNTVGVTGKGLAADFKRFYPDMIDAYRDLCDQGKFDIGRLWLYRTPHKWVLNFPVQKHWRSASKPEYIASGLQKFVAVYAEQGLTSVSFPAVGDGIAGLHWEEDVRPLMEAYLAPLPIMIYVHLEPEIIDRRSSRSIGTWLAQPPATVSFDKLWRDLARMIKRQSEYVTVGGAEAFTIEMDTRPRSRNLILTTADGQTIFLSTSLLSDLWNYIRSAGYALPGNFPGELDAHAPYIITLFSELNYVEQIDLSLDGEAFQGGLHYLPPANKKGLTVEQPIAAEIDRVQE